MATTSLPGLQALVANIGLDPIPSFNAAHVLNNPAIYRNVVTNDTLANTLSLQLYHSNPRLRHKTFHLSLYSAS